MRDWRDWTTRRGTGPPGRTIPLPVERVKEGLDG